MLLLLILLVVLGAWLVVQRWQKRGMYKLWSQLKNDLTVLPFIGHAYIFLGSDEDRMNVFKEIGTQAYNTGGLFAIWQGSRLYLSVSDAETAEVISKACLEKDDVHKTSRSFTGNGTIFAPVPIWRPRRKFLAPTFSPKNLSQFMGIFTKQSNVMVHQLRKAVGKGSFSIWNYITTYSMDAVCESTLGVQVNFQHQPDQPFLKAFEEICKLDSARMCQPWLHNNTIYKMTPYYSKYALCKAEVCGFIEQIIKNKRQSMNKEKEQPRESSEHNGGNNIKTFLELLIESSGGERGYSDLELLEESLVLVLAGTDTSAVGTSFTALMLARHQHIQRKLYQEIQEVFGNSERPIVAEDLPHLKYLDAVIKETLRLYPPVPVVARKAMADVQLPSGVVLARDCGALLNIWAIHRNPKYWGADAGRFLPERWLQGSNPHPAAFLPFSYGPRACIGYRYAMMSMKTAITTLLRHYILHPATPVTDEHAPLRTKFDVMMKDVDNFKLQLEIRVK